MKVIVGLGNPGSKYEKTRHNVGFDTIDYLSERLSLPLDKKKFNARFGMKKIDHEQVILCKPLTYMNLSGEAVRPLLKYFKLEQDQLLVIYDDLDLSPGKIRLREKGGAGGHNGIKSLINHLGTEHFKRIRIGIGHPPERMSTIDYVLGMFPREDQSVMDESIQRAGHACEMWITDTFPNVMNEYNKR